MPGREVNIVGDSSLSAEEIEGEDADTTFRLSQPSCSLANNTEKFPYILEVNDNLVIVAKSGGLDKHLRIKALKLARSIVTSARTIFTALLTNTQVEHRLLLTMKLAAVRH